MFKGKGSRRVVGLKPADFDHEIGLIDHDEAVSRYTTTNRSSSESPEITRVSTTAQLRPRSGEDNGEQGSSVGREINGSVQVEERPPADITHQQTLPQPALSPTIEVQGE